MIMKMKRTIALGALFIAFLGTISFSTVNAQETNQSLDSNGPKIGHINSSELLQLMPEREQIEKDLQAYQAQLESQLKTMSTEYQNKVTDYQQNEKTWSDLVKQTKVREITEMEGRIQEFRAGAEEDLMAQEQKLVQPLLDKAQKAIKDVASEYGYDYVLDTSSGAVLHFPESEDILPLVKKHLNIL
ncbi:MAG: hypothetical protein CL843_03765 [Crocinitomicaceae bacterium]|nr:hypothetical protein [Crocinitomicaceae bacterium]